MRKGTPREDFEHVVTAYGRHRSMETAAAYLMLLDPRGVVRWRHNGPMDEEAFAGLSCQTAALLN